MDGLSWAIQMTAAIDAVFVTVVGQEVGLFVLEILTLSAWIINDH